MDDMIVELLRSLEGKVVSVSWTTVPMLRKGFHTQVSVTGMLEAHPSNESWRVMAGGPGTYAYIHPKDVVGLIGKGSTAEQEGHIFVGSLGDDDIVVAGFPGMEEGT